MQQNRVVEAQKALDRIEKLIKNLLGEQNERLVEIYAN